jgi:hypothetical protein
MDTHRSRNVLDLLLTQVLEREGEFVANLVADNAADANPAGLGSGFEPCRDINPVAVNISPVPDDVAEIDPHAEFNAAIRRYIGVSLGHSALHFDGAAHRVDDAGELDEQSVAGGLDDPASVLLDLGITQLTSDRLQFGKRTFLILAHLAANSRPRRRLGWRRGDVSRPWLSRPSCSKIECL